MRNLRLLLIFAIIVVATVFVSCEKENVEAELVSQKDEVTLAELDALFADRSTLKSSSYTENDVGEQTDPDETYLFAVVDPSGA